MLHAGPLKPVFVNYFSLSTYGAAYICLPLGQIQAYMTACSVFESEGNFNLFLLHSCKQIYLKATRRTDESLSIHLQTVSLLCVTLDIN